MPFAHISTPARAQTDLRKSEIDKSYFDPLAPRTYDVIVVDPPWSFATRSPKGQGRSASMHYDVMTIAEIMQLPIRELLKGSAMVLLWVTAPMLDQAFAVMKA